MLSKGFPLIAPPTSSAALDNLRLPTLAVGLTRPTDNPGRIVALRSWSAEAPRESFGFQRGLVAPAKLCSGATAIEGKLAREA